MNKVELALPTDEWGTLKSKYAPDIKQVLVDEFTRGTVNIDTQTKGAITKRKGGTVYNPTALTLPLKDQYEAIFSDGVRHTLGVQSGEIKYTAGDRIFNSVVNGTGFVAGSNFEFELVRDRVYGDNGANDPIVYDRQANYGGVTYTVPRIRPMGAQAPLTAPTAGSPTSGGSVPLGAHTYRVTFLYYDSEESNGSPASGVQTSASTNNTIPLTSIPIGGYGVTARKIYRDNNNGVYVLIHTITDNTTTSYSDTNLAGTTPLPTDQGLPPVFSQIVLFLDSLFVAGVPGNPSVVYYSATAFPDVFPELNFVICNQKDPITALVVYQDRIIVFNRKSMGQILGRTPDQYRYSHIPGSVGCVDSRSIQTRTIDGVPVLVWLSDKGFYSYNGNSVTYISEDIEDQVNFNIQQSNYQDGSYTDDTQAQFNAGTASNGIDLDSFPGIITTDNPTRLYDDQGDWEGGLVTTNISTKDGTNKLKTPTRFIPVLADGNFITAIQDGTDIKLPVGINFPGEDHVNDASPFSGMSSSPVRNGWAQKVVIPKVGTLGTVIIKFDGNLVGAHTMQIRIWSDFGGSPGTILFSGAGFTSADGVNRTETPNLVISATGTYWIGAVQTSGAVGVMSPRETTLPVFANGSKIFNTSTVAWETSSKNIALTYTLCQTPVASSGQWLSTIWDTNSAFISTTLNLAVVASYPSTSFCSGGAASHAVIAIEGSDQAAFLSGAEVSQNLNDLNGNSNLSISGKRYWRIRISMSSNDDRITPVVGTPTLKFNQTATWVSQVIDLSSDVTVYNALTVVSNTPAGTSVTATVASSADGVTFPDGFVSFGSVVVRRYLKIQLVLSNATDGSVGPDVSSVLFNWTIVANFVSAPIDTAAIPPAGWGIFQTSDAANGGTLQYFMRSGASLVALASASYVAVTPETLPPVTLVPLQYVQWKVIITSTANSIPQIDSVTVRWLITQVQSLRAASIFTDRRYFVAVATVGSLFNNVVFELDVDNNWRIHSGLNISTLAFFFNSPYYGSATIGKMYQLQQGFLDDEATNIPIDIRTKAFDFSSKYGDESSSFKTLTECMLIGVGTGASYTMEYSVDNGLTFITIPTDTGSMSLTTLNNGARFAQRFRVSYAYGNVVSGRTIMIRITTNDAFDIQIHTLKIRAWIRNQEYD